METLRRAWESIRTMWAGLSTSHRIVVGLLAFALVAVVVWGASAAGSAGERQIVGPETPFEVQAAVLAELDSMGVHYRVSNGRIYVAADKADEIYVKLQGILSDDMKVPEQDFFSDRWQQEKRWQAALQAKLGRMIMRLDGVRSATVQLVPAKESNWRGEQSEGSASVMVELKPGGTMDGRLVNAIVQTVSGGSGIKAQSVKVMSGSTVYGVDDANVAPAPGFHEQEMALGKQIAQMVEKLLPVEARIMVAVRLSPKRVEEQNVTPGRSVPKSEDGQKVEYFNGTTEIKSWTPAGAEITSLSVAVVIPEKPPVPTVDVDRAQFISTVSSIVSKATGATEDRITVATVPVVVPAVVTPSAWEDAWEGISRNLGQILLVVLALVIGFALWRVVRASIQRAPAVTVEEGRPGLEAALAGVTPQEAEASRLKASVSEAALREPREAAEVVRRMMER